MKRSRLNFSELFANILSICAIIAILFGIALSYIFIENMAKEGFSVWQNREVLGMIGEFLGGTVGSIWALAGVILFFLALIYQKRELELQRIELHESRKIMEAQSTTIAIQQFENTFFQLLNFHINAAENIRSWEEGKKVNAFDAIFLDLKKEVNALKKRRKSDAGVAQPADESIEQCFSVVYEGYKNTFQHYLENYKTLLFFVQNKSNDPGFYYDILKSHLTEQEVLIQFYYAVLHVKKDQLNSIIEEYHLFEKLNHRTVKEVDPYHLDKLKPTAFSVNS